MINGNMYRYASIVLMPEGIRLDGVTSIRYGDAPRRARGRAWWHAEIRSRPGRYWKRRRMPARWRRA